MSENKTVQHRAGVVPEEACKGCMCFRGYMIGSPARNRGLIGECTLGRAEEPPNTMMAAFQGRIPCMVKK